jgi:hypothetical protein
MTSSAGPVATWPADVIHVNEDGWVLINRGTQHGVPVGLRLVVIGAGARELRDLFPAAATPPADARPAEGDAGEDGETADAMADEPVVLRTRRTYELLEIVHVEADCAVAIAARTPAERRPEFYRGPDGDLLVWVPLPADFTYPRADSADEEDEEDEEEPYDEADTDAEDGADQGAPEIDSPPQRADQEDERWEQALPLNGVGVGDQVVPAVPVSAAQPAQPRTTRSAPGTRGTSGTSGTSGASGASATQPASGEQSLTPFEQGRSYDWMKPQS